MADNPWDVVSTEPVKQTDDSWDVVSQAPVGPATGVPSMPAGFGAMPKAPVPAGLAGPATPGTNAFGQPPSADIQSALAQRQASEQASQRLGVQPVASGVGSFLMSPYAGAQQVGQGIQEAKNAQGLQGAADVIGGAMTAATPLVPLGLATAPIKTAVGLGAGYLGGKMAGGITGYFSDDPAKRQLAEELGGLASGAGAASLAPATLARPGIPVGAARGNWFQDYRANRQWKAYNQQKYADWGKAVNLMAEATGAGRNDTKFDQKMHTSMALTKALEAQRGHAIGDVPGGTETDKLDDGIAATRDAQRQVIDTYNKLTTPAMIQGIQIPGNQIVQDALAQIRPDINKYNPSAAAAMQQDLIRRYAGQTFTIPDALQRRQTLNDNYSSLAKMAPSSAQAAIDSSVNDAYLDAERVAVKNAIEQALGGNGGANIPRELMRRYGALEDQQNYLVAQRTANLGASNINARRALGFFLRSVVQAGMGEYRGTAANVASGTSNLIPVSKAGTKMAQAFKNYNYDPKAFQLGMPTPAQGPAQLGPGMPPPPQVGPGAGPVTPFNSPSFRLGQSSPQSGAIIPAPQSPLNTSGISVQHIPQLEGQVQQGPFEQSTTIPRGQIQRPPMPKSKQLGAAKQMFEATPEGEVVPRGTGPLIPSSPLDTSGIKVQEPAPYVDEETGEIVGYSGMPKTPEQPYISVSRAKPPALAAGGTVLNGPSPALVGEAGPEVIQHSDGTPPELVEGPQVRTLGTTGTDQVVPLTKQRTQRTPEQLALDEQSRFDAAKHRLDAQFNGFAKKNKWPIPPGTLSDQQNLQYQHQLGQLQDQLKQRLEAIKASQAQQASQPPMPALAGGGIVNMGQSGQDVIRGSSNIPLAPEGEQDALKIAGQLPGVFNAIYSSDLLRAQQTAQALSQTNPQAGPPQLLAGLRPWHLGQLEGQPTDQVVDTINDYIKNHPDQVIPGRGPLSTADGESFNSFAHRATGALNGLLDQQASMPGSRIAAVTHYRDLKLANALSNSPDGQLDPETMTAHSATGDAPTSIHRLTRTPHGGMHVSSVKPQKNLPEGVYLIRHGKTALNGETRGKASASGPLRVPKPPSVSSLTNRRQQKARMPKVPAAHPTSFPGR